MRNIGRIACGGCIYRLANLISLCGTDLPTGQMLQERNACYTSIGRAKYEKKRLAAFIPQRSQLHYYSNNICIYIPGCEFLKQTSERRRIFVRHGRWHKNHRSQPAVGDRVLVVNPLTQLDPIYVL